MYENMNEWLINVRRDFHQNPELGMEEHRTSSKISEYLTKMGIEHKTGIANTGIVGIIRGGQDGKTVALRADMDALPIIDEKQVDYSSKIPGRMHACGHDAHVTILLGAAKILNDMKSSLKGNVKLIFQPAEETTGGAKPMIDEGVMDNPNVDAVFGLHVDPEIEAGKIGIKYGKMNAASDMFHVIIKGKSTHGAYPHSGVDAIAAAAQVISALQNIVSRNVDPRDSAVLSIGMINGGTAGNIMCDKVELRGIIRTLTPDTRSMVLERAKSIVKQVSEAMGAEGEFIRHESYTALINDDYYVDIVKKNGERLLDSDKVIVKKEASMGVEDFAYFLQNAPGAFFNLGCRNEEKGIVHDLHNCLFDIDETCLSIGVALQVENVLSVLK